MSSYWLLLFIATALLPTLPVYPFTRNSYQYSLNFRKRIILESLIQKWLVGISHILNLSSSQAISPPRSSGLMNSSPFEMEYWIILELHNYNRSNKPATGDVLEHLWHTLSKRIKNFFIALILLIYILVCANILK